MPKEPLPVSELERLAGLNVSEVLPHERQDPWIYVLPAKFGPYLYLHKIKINQTIDFFPHMTIFSSHPGCSRAIWAAQPSCKLVRLCTIILTALKVVERLEPGERPKFTQKSILVHIIEINECTSQLRKESDVCTAHHMHVTVVDFIFSFTKLTFIPAKECFL